MARRKIADRVPVAVSKGPVGMFEQDARKLLVPAGDDTDHRINLTMYNLNAVINGDLQEIIDKLQMAENAERLKESGLT